SAEEALNGSVYKPAGVCLQQGWSETMILQPISEGMLGLDPDAPANRISISPRFPWQWQKVSVENILFGEHRLNLIMSRNQNTTTYSFMNLSAKECSVSLKPSLPLGSTIQKVLINGKEVSFSTLRSTESIDL